MKVLLTGAGGFVGPHLARALADAGHDPVLTDRVGADTPLAVQALDVCDPDAVTERLCVVRPDAVIHLAAITSVPEAQADPAQARALNVKASAALLEAVRTCVPSARVVLASSSEVYGREAVGPLDEDAPLAPRGVYAQTKAAADAHALSCAADQWVAVVRAQNHTGPGQSTRFVVPSFAAQVLAGAPMRVGNLESERPFLDVRDVARAYVRVLEDGERGAAYNVGASALRRVGDVLEELMAIVGQRPAVEVDPDRWRPTDAVPLLATSRVRALGWSPQVPWGRTLRDVVAAVRSAQPVR